MRFERKKLSEKSDSFLRFAALLSTSPPRKRKIGSAKKNSSAVSTALISSIRSDAAEKHSCAFCVCVCALSIV